MNDFEVIIGIEIHLELNTKTKMFSPAINNFDAEPNTNINVIDLGYPGTLLLLNKQAVIFAVQLARALKMEIDTELHFDRKNYYYTDLPKGFQITQYYRPIGKNGVLSIRTSQGEKKIQIERIHLEEDTARQHHDGEITKLDYNRAGVPLIEIVTYPVLRSSEEAVAYVDMIRKVALSLGISDAKMENGSLRADVNISLRPFGYSGFGTKVEIKNINTFSNMKKAIDFEIELQSRKIIRNEKILQQTKRFDEKLKENVVMRTKTGEVDYKYFPEPNIPLIKLTDSFLQKIKLNELPWEKEERYKSYNLNQIYIDSLTNNLRLATYFDSINYFDKDKLSKLFFAEVVSLANSKNVEVDELNIQKKHLEQALNLLDQEVLSGKSFKKLIPLLCNFNENSIDSLVEEHKLAQISDINVINKWVDEILAKKPESFEEFKNRPDRVTKMLLGEIMKLSEGRVNPTIANQQLLEKLSIKN
ncbi:Asp-tRNA(Asn)/Glu-tRNA(Gln) amidotransferase subunit GatB [Mycoplasmopsis columbinasalis]|uniref:Aspartyl/glutamyl-tRNA(Asn/Gln) amidotransferase subunit B n=1 Tax=Mycoplasmopsis columbinasalis TaxID=114880 RepID=A0A449BAB0_9BACT|nr:Asp-tRNA(Asn)/Glu-tRNA(Gln) amidotransferase subunit GatB [Mycoplasmopsis columbinasalis]VEU78140.1 Aspartyl/glutamyl-tRNA(Asn/Gln) amidotransferase subunit B [Mycoplasmopsis columbinasalis]